MKQTHKLRAPERQKGAALIVSLIVLVVLTLVALSGMNSALLQEKMAANAQNSNRLFQAAESAVSALTNLAKTDNTYLNTAIIDTDSVAAPISFTINDPDITSTFQARYLGEAKLTTGDTIGGGEDHARLRTQRFELIGESTMTSVSGQRRIFQGIDYHL